MPRNFQSLSLPHLHQLSLESEGALRVGEFCYYSAHWPSSSQVGVGVRHDPVGLRKGQRCTHSLEPTHGASANTTHNISALAFRNDHSPCPPQLVSHRAAFPLRPIPWFPGDIPFFLWQMMFDVLGQGILALPISPIGSRSETIG